MKTSGTVYTIIFTFITAFFFIAILAAANEFTRPRIELNQQLTLQQAVLRAGGISFTADTEVNQLFTTRVSRPLPDQPDLYVLKNDAEQTVYALRFTGQGLWGTITGILAVDASIRSVTGVEVIAHNETPGLGGKIDAEYFKAQYYGERIGPDGTLRMGTAGPGDKDHTNSRVDGISGATRTSELFGGIINHGLAQIRQLAGEVTE